MMMTVISNVAQNQCKQNRFKNIKNKALIQHVHEALKRN